MVDVSTVTLDEGAVLRRLLELSLDAGATSAALESAPDADLRGLAATLFLLDEQAGCDVLRFLEDGLSRILQHLTRRTEQQRVEYRSRVRGRVAWPATYKARYGEDYDPARFVCYEVRHEFDTPENQLVKRLVAQIDDCLLAVPAILQTGVCYYPAAMQRGPSVVASRLAELKTALGRFSRNVYMRSVSLPDEITAAHEQRAITAKLVDYQAAAALHQHLNAGAAAPARASIRRYLASQGRWPLPLPGRAGDKAEPWIGYAAAVLRAGICK
jgi:hypothetical protein